MAWHSLNPKGCHIRGEGKSAIGQVALLDPLPHPARDLVCRGPLRDERGPQPRLEALEVGDIVQISGEVLSREAPSAPASGRRQSFVALFCRAIAIQFAEGGKDTQPTYDPTPVKPEEVFPKPETFGIPIYLLLSDIRTADLSQMREPEVEDGAGLLDELNTLDRLYQELANQSTTGLVGRVEGALDCTAFLDSSTTRPVLSSESGLGPSALHAPKGKAQ